MATAEIANNQQLTSKTGNAVFLNPEKIIESLSIRQGMKIADFGAGAGYFTIPLARLVGHTGKVFAIDIQKHALNLIKSRAKLEHLLNIDFLWADLEIPLGSKLKDASADLVIISNILFQAEKKNEIFNEAFRALKPGGNLAVFEWDQSNFAGGPPANLRLPPDRARILAEEAGFAFEKEFAAGSHHYGFLFKKP